MKRLAITIVTAMALAIVADAAPKKKRNTTAYEDLTEQVSDALNSYDIAQAQELMERWEASAKRAKRDMPAAAETLRARIILMDNMLQRVEDIVVVDSVTVPRSSLAAAIPLPAAAGRLNTRQILPPNVPADDNTIVYTANDGREIFWNAPDSNGLASLYHAGILDDGTLENPVKVFPDIDYATAYPFMLTDGSTLYFAAQDTATSIGGYDLYMTRRDDESGDFLEPVNLGMPYNSPYNDILIAIDTDNNIGWWATDRNSLDSDSITIYTYIPNKTRRNLDVTRQDLADRAFVTDIAATRTDDIDIAAIHARISANAAARSEDTQNVDTRLPYPFSIEGRGVYYTLGDFRSTEAQSLMKDYLRQYNLDRAHRRQLDILRQRYAAGDKTIAADIRNLEDTISAAVPALRRLRNAVIRAELL